MALLDSLLTAGAAIVLWSLLLYVLQKRGLLERRGLAPSPPPAGPFLLWKTLRGRPLLDRLARPKRFLRVFWDIPVGPGAPAVLRPPAPPPRGAALRPHPAAPNNPPPPPTPP